MDPATETLYRQLPTVHAVALRLEARGATAEEISAVLGVAPEAVPGLLLVAQAKVAELARVAG